MPSVHATRVSDDRPLYLDTREIRYGSPTKNSTLAAALLRKTRKDGDATYHVAPGARFGDEVFVIQRQEGA